MRIAIWPLFVLCLIVLTWNCASGDEIDPQVEQLRSGDFQQREATTRAMIAAGEQSIPAAKQAAVDRDLEVRIRALRVLVSLAVSSDANAARLAEAALGELAKSPNADVAQPAGESLESVHLFREQQRDKDLDALRKLGGVALLNERSEVYRIDFEGEYITDEGLEAQRNPPPKLAPADEDRLAEAEAKREFAAKYIVRTHVNDGDLMLLAKFPNVTYLNMRRTAATDAGLVHLKSLDKLEYLILNEQITDDGLRQLAGLTELKSLGLAQTHITGVGFDQLTKLTKLAEFDLSNSLVSDAGLKAISAHQGLQTLKLGNTKITDEGASHLRHLRKLQLLVLNHTEIGDAALAIIAQLEDLRTLNLDGTNVTDRGLAVLTQLAHLQAVSFTEPKVSKEAVERLRAEMPKTTFYLWPAIPRR